MVGPVESWMVAVLFQQVADIILHRMLISIQVRFNVNHNLSKYYMVNVLKFRTLFTNEMLVIRTGIYKRPVIIDYREDSEQKQSDLCLGCLSVVFFGWQREFKILEHLHLVISRQMLSKS